MHKVGLNVVEQSLVVRNHDGGIVGAFECVHPLRHNSQGIDIESAIGFVEDAQSGFEHRHLENFVALFLTARKTLVHGTRRQFVVELDHGALFAHQFQKFGCAKWLLVKIFALFVDGGTHKVDHRHTRYFHRILKTEKQAFVGAVFRRKRQQIFAIEFHFASGHGVSGVAGEHGAQRTFPRPIRTHNGVHFSRANGEVDSFQYFFTLN